MKSSPLQPLPPSCPAAGLRGRSAPPSPASRSTATTHTGSKRARIIALRKKHPQASIALIARLVGTSTYYVQHTLRETGFVDDVDVVALGKLARDLGFTRETLRTIAAQWR